MIQWEYKVRVLNFTPGSLKEHEFLNEQGKDGWELCAISPTYYQSNAYYYFKRQITNNNE